MLGLASTLLQLNSATQAKSAGRNKMKHSLDSLGCHSKENWNCCLVVIQQPANAQVLMCLHSVLHADPAMSNQKHTPMGALLLCTPP